MIRNRINDNYQSNLNKVKILGTHLFFMANEDGQSPRAYFKDLNKHLRFVLGDIIGMCLPLADINQVFGKNYTDLADYLANCENVMYIQNPTVVKVLDDKCDGLGSIAYQYIEKIDTKPQTIRTLQMNVDDLAKVFNAKLPKENRYEMEHPQPLFEQVFG